MGYPSATATLTQPDTFTGDVYFKSGRPWVDVRAYGAVGDGVADDTTAIQNALTAASNLGGAEVFVPPGTYLANVTLPSKIILVGAGIGATTFKSNVNTTPVVSFSDGNGQGVRDLTIDGNAKTASVGIKMSGAVGQIFNASLERVRITGCLDTGLFLGGGYRNQFRDLRVDHNAIGLQIPAAGASRTLDSLGQFTFDSCWFADNTSKGVYLQGGSIMSFFGGNIEHNGTASGIGCHIAPDAVNGAFVFTGVNFEQNGDYTSGIGLKTSSNVRGLFVNDCQFTGNAGNTAQWKGFDIAGISTLMLGVNIQGHATKSTLTGNEGWISRGLVIGPDGWTITGANWIDIQGATIQGAQDLIFDGPLGSPGYLRFQRDAADDYRLGRISGSDHLQLQWWNGSAWIGILTALSTGTLRLDATTALGGGTGISKYLSATATLDFGNILAAAAQDLTVTVTGAAVGDSVYAMPSTTIESGIVWNAWVSAADTVTIRANNAGAIAVDPASRSWRVDVWKH